MKHIQVYALLLLSVCHTSCGQKQTETHKDNINYSIKDTVTSNGPKTMVRNVKQDRNGNILIAASWGGVFRYDPARRSDSASLRAEGKISNNGYCPTCYFPLITNE